MTEPRRLCAALVERARSAGTLWSEAAIQETTTRVCMGRRDPPRVQGPEMTLSFRVGTDDGHVGVVERVVKESLDPAAIVDRALTRTKSGRPDPMDGPFERMDLATQGLQINDPRLPRLTDADRREVVVYNEDAVRSVSKGLGVVSMVYEELLTRRYVVTSRGLDGAEAGSRFRLRGVVRPTANPALEVGATVESRRFADVASVPLGTDLSRRALALASPAVWPERALPVVVEPRVLAGLLPQIAQAFDADRVAAGKSFIRSDALDARQVLGSTKLHMVDDACVPGALETRAFDDRGVAPMPLPLIREGTLGALYRSPRSARLHGTRPTGHTRADGSAWPGTLIVRPGGRSRNMMFPDVGRYIIIDEIVDYSGLDLKSGELRLPVRLALGEQGQIIGGLGEAVLETTVLRFFESISEMASDTERHGSVDACTWVLEGIGFSR